MRKLREYFNEIRKISYQFRGIFKIIIEYKGYFSIAIVLMFINTFFTTLGLSIIVPVIDLFTETKSPTLITKKIQLFLTKLGFDFNILNTLLLFLIIISVEAFFRFIETIYSEKIRRKIFVNLTLKCYSNLMNVAYSFFHSKRKSDLNLILSYSGQAAHSSYECMNLLSQIIMMFGYLFFLFFLSFKLTIFISCLSIPLGIFFVRYTIYTKKVASQIVKLKADYGHNALEAIESIKIVKSYCNEPYEIERYKRVLKEHERLYYTLNKKLAFMNSIMQPLIFIILLLVIIFGKYVLFSPFALISVYLFTLYKFLPQGLGFINYLNIVTQKLPAANLALDLMSDKNKPYIKNGEIIFDGNFRKIILKNIYFCYRDNEYVLKNINLEIPKNKTIAIIGRSGSGKSTIADLLLRFYDPLQGKILIDDIDLKQIEIKSYLNKVAIVTQDIYIFNDTIKQNIKYGKLDATDEEIYNAAELAYCYEFIKELPEGFNTKVGDRGVKLSGGQKQRISLARALLKDSSILVLDEATSSLDSDSEKSIQEAIYKLYNNKTIVIIAHRLSTIIHSDIIYVIENGKIVEFGSHEKLLKKGKHYLKYYKLQYTDKEK